MVATGTGDRWPSALVVTALPVIVVAALLACAPLAAQEALTRGQELLERGDFAAAEAALREATEEDPTSAPAHTALAHALFSQRKVEEAVQVGERAVGLDPQSLEARETYGRALYAARRPVEAARQLERVVDADPDDPARVEALAAAWAGARDDRVVEAYRRLFELVPDAPKYHVRLAKYYWGTDRSDQGNDVLDEALDAFPEEKRLHKIYGQALFSQDRAVDAVGQLQQARAAGISDLPTLSLLSYALWRAGDVDGAMAAFTEALEEFPQAGSLHQDFGRFLLSVREPERALTELLEAERLQPGKAHVYLELGRAHEAVGNVEEAEKAYRKSIELGPQLATPHYLLGRLLTLHGDKQEAQRELTLYREIYDRTARREQEIRRRKAEIDKARTELRHGDAEAALALFASMPESTATLTGQADALSRLGRHDEAVRILERASELEPANHEIRVQLASEQVRAEETP